eukprot:TRINITY_DN27358_c0_g1_i1.p1 TRINITY_DN27358_c0_g1~~TRINITY_DN27358_c0_g1_i1.p1  ORF type:complete len:878 (+),score=132.75 TRINITY_DN27358_c0_g1_i1:97-2730(+)
MQLVAALVFLLMPNSASSLLTCEPTTSAVPRCVPRADLAPNLFRQPLKLRWDAWATSQLATSVAAILLQDRLGIEVELVRSSSSMGVYEAVATGTIHAAFEVWPAGKEAAFSKFASFESCSEKSARAFNASIVGRSGIYETCSRRTTDGTMQQCRSAAILDSPTRLSDVLATSVGQTHFASPGISSAANWTPSHCVGANCTAQIFHISGYDPGLIENMVTSLQLPTTVTYFDEAEHHKLVWTAHEAREGALFYFYRPSIPIHGIYAHDFPRAVIWPKEDVQNTFLQKLAWTGLLDIDGLDAATFVQNFMLSYADYEELSESYLVLQDVNAAACRWVKNNKEKWKPWIKFPQRGLQNFSLFDSCVTRMSLIGNSESCDGGCGAMFFLQLSLSICLFALLACCRSFSQRHSSKEIKPLIARSLRRAKGAQTGEFTDAMTLEPKMTLLERAKGAPRKVRDSIIDIEQTLEHRGGDFSSAYKKNLEFAEAYQSAPVAIQHVRSFSVFCRSNVDPHFQRPRNYPATLWVAGHSRVTLYLFFVCSGAMLKVVLCCLAFSLISGSISSACWLVLRHEVYQMDDAKFAAGLATPDGTLSRSFAASARAFDSFTNNFKFFPAFLILGYVGFTISRWRDFLNIGYSIQGRIHDVSLMVGGAIADPSSEACKRLAFNVYRYLTVVHLFVYKSKHPWLAELTMDDIIALGLLTEAEVRRLKPADNKMRDAVVGWLSREIQLGLHHGLLHSSCATTCLDQLAGLRGKMAAFHDTFTLNQPNMYASMMTAVVDMLVLLFVISTPFTMFVYQQGCFQWYVVGGCAYLIVPWVSCLQIISIVADPFTAKHDFFNVDSLMGSSEQVAFHNLRTSFDFPVQEEPPRDVVEESGFE